MENNQLGCSESTTMTLTESAISKLKTLLADQEPGTMFRIFVQGGGCSGFEYGFNFETKKINDLQEYKDMTIAYILITTSVFKI